MPLARPISIHALARRALPLAALGALLAGALLLSAQTARATVLRGLDLPGICRGSDLIVRGRVERTRAGWAGGRIVTAVTLRVERVLKGPVGAGRAVTLYRLGGELGGIGQFVPGAPRFRVGERVLVFLRTWRGRHFVNGMGQGKLRVIPARAGRPAQVLPPGVGAPLLGAGRVLQRPVDLRIFESRVRAVLRSLGRAPARASGRRRP